MYYIFYNNIDLLFLNVLLVLNDQTWKLFKKLELQILQFSILLL